MVAYLGHSSLNPELSQFIVPKLIWPSSGTFQHHHQLSTSEDTASCLLGRLDTHQRASLCGQLEFASKTSLIITSRYNTPKRLLSRGKFTFSVSKACLQQHDVDWPTPNSTDRYRKSYEYHSVSPFCCCRPQYTPSSPSEGNTEAFSYFCVRRQRKIFQGFKTFRVSQS